MAQRKRRTKRAPHDDLSHYKDLAELLRFLVSSKQGLLGVRQVRDVVDEIGGNEYPLTEVIVSVSVPNPRRVADGLRNIPVERYREFFESWPVQKKFLLWLGNFFAESLPNSEAAAKYRRQFEKLATGRPSKLPPNFYLQPQQERLVAQLRITRLFIHDRGNDHHTDLGRQEFLRFAKENGFDWTRLVEKNELSLTDIVTGNLQGTAHYVLSVLHKVSIEAVRSKLLRTP